MRVLIDLSEPLATNAYSTFVLCKRAQPAYSQTRRVTSSPLKPIAGYLIQIKQKESPMSTKDDDHTPAYTKPIPAKKPVERSPQLSSSEMTMDAVVGMRKSSRRIAVVKAIDILLQRNTDMLDHFELALETAKAQLNGKA